MLKEIPFIPPIKCTIEEALAIRAYARTYRAMQWVFERKDNIKNFRFKSDEQQLEVLKEIADDVRECIDLGFDIDDAVDIAIEHYGYSSYCTPRLSLKNIKKLNELYNGLSDEESDIADTICEELGILDEWRDFCDEYFDVNEAFETEEYTPLIIDGEGESELFKKIVECIKE